MQIKHLKLNNFCGFFGSKTFDHDFFEKTEITGANEAGKSTVKKAIFWIFNCRDENGKEISGIRPHDENGNDINDLEVSAELTVDVDGTVKILKKVSRQNLNKKGEFTGNVIDYYINDIPKKASDYAEYISSFAEEYVPYCMNAMTLLLKSSVDQRAVLANAFGKHSDTDICDMYPEFEELKPLFEDGNIEELKKRCNTQLNGTRGKSGTKGLKSLLDEIPSRIDEANRGRLPIDTEKLESEKKSLKVLLNENLEKQTDLGKILSEADKISDGILELQFSQNELKRSANEENVKKRIAIESEISALKDDKRGIEKSVSALEKEISDLELEATTYKNKISLLRGKYKEAYGRKFDENSTVCPYCGQEYPEDRKQQLRDEFDIQKKDELEKITAEGNTAKSSFENAVKQSEELKNSIPVLQDKSNVFALGIQEKEADLSTIPEFVDVSNTDEYINLQKAIEEKKEALDRYSDISEVKRNLKVEEASIRQRIAECNGQLARTAENKRIDSRVAELEMERRYIAQKITDVERQLYLLKEFSLRKNELLQNEVNEYLDFCSVKMFRPLINGDIEECCEFTYRGEMYSRNLNHGCRILTEIDICRAFQKRCNYSFPIIIDDAESVDGWRIPNIENQVLILRRSDSELKVLNVERR